MEFPTHFKHCITLASRNRFSYLPIIQFKFGYMRTIISLYLAIKRCKGLYFKYFSVSVRDFSNNENDHTRNPRRELPATVSSVLTPLAE